MNASNNSIIKKNIFFSHFQTIFLCLEMQVSYCCLILKTLTVSVTASRSYKDRADKIIVILCSEGTWGSRRVDDLSSVTSHAETRAMSMVFSFHHTIWPNLGNE